MDVVVRPHVLSDREAATLDCAEGTTLAQMVAAFPWPDGVERHVVALVNGQCVPREWWPRVRPLAGARVLLALGLSNGEGDKQTLALIASIAVSVASMGAASSMMAAGYTSFAAGIASAGIAIVGNLAIAAIFKPPPVRFDQNPGQSVSKQYTFGGQSNALRPYGVLPRVLGKHRVYPDLIGTPYTEIKGDDQWLKALYCFGYGGVTIEAICIGDNPIDNYESIYRPWPDYKRGDPLELYLTDVAMDQYALATSLNTAVFVRTRPDTNSATLDISYPSGLGKLNMTNGGIDPVSALTRLYFRAASAAAGDPWLPVVAAPWWSISEGVMSGRYPATITATLVQATDPAAPRYATIPKGTTTVTLTAWDTTRPPKKDDYLRFGGYARALVLSFAPPVVTLTAPTAIAISIPDYGSGSTASIAAAYDTTDPSIWTVTRHQYEPFITAFTIHFPSSGQWDIQIIQVTPPDGSASADRTVTGLRSEKLGSIPVYPDIGVPLALLELKIKATAQLSGVVATLNAIVTTKVPTWTGSAWTAADVVGASNPAWQFCELLRGVANTRAIDANPAVAPTRLDMVTIKRWADYCDTVAAGFTEPNGRCNFVVDRPYTLWELLSSVCTAGRAMPTMKDNRYSVIIDEEVKPEIQIFSSRNSWGLSARRKYLPLPHALRAKWVNPKAGYVEDDAPIYAAGYSEQGEAGGTVAARVFEDLTLFGCTSWEQANRDGRLWFARAQLQQEEFSISTDIENVVCTRGDLIGIAHDVLQVGGWSARIAARTGADLQFDSTLKPFATPWALRHRSAAGAISAALPFIAKVGSPGWFTVTGLPASAAVGDLVLYGTSGVEQGRYIVKAVTPGNDLTATIDCIEYAPGIYAAEKGPIPPYVPQGQSPQTFNPQPVLGLTATVTAWTDGRYPHASVTLQWTPPASTLPPVNYIVSSVAADGTSREIARTTNLTYTPLPDAETWHAPYSGAVVRFSVTPQWQGLVGPASIVSATLPVGSVAPLGAITGLTATPEARRVFVQWTASGTTDTAFYVVRYGPAGSTWASTAATEQKIKANQLDLPAAKFIAGSWLVFVLQEDAAGQRSASISAPFTVLPPRAVNIVGTAVQNTVFLRWGSLSGIPAGDWTSQTTFQVEYYEVTKTKLAGLDAAMRVLPGGLGTIAAELVTAQDLAQQRAEERSDPPVDLGRYAGEFAVLSEQQVGNWHYCMRGVDVPGNLAPQACIDIAVFAPSNYLLLDTLANILNTPECIKTNAVQNPDLSWLAPVNETETWAQHYTSHAWVKPADQIAAGFPVYAQPPGTTKGTFSWTHDYGTALPSLRLTAAAYYSGIGGTPVVTVILFSKINAGDAWGELARTNTSVTALLPPTTRYIRIDTEVLSDSPTNKALAQVDRVQFILDVQFKDDSGVVTVPSVTGTPPGAVAGVATVVFNVPFLDVRSVQLTSNDPAIAYARYDLAPDDQSMTVYSFNASAVPTGGKVAWSARGI